MMVSKAFDTKTGTIIISIIFGLGLAALFRQTCKGDRCIIIKSPDVEEVHNNVYRYNQECYKYTADMVPCPMKTKAK